MQTFSKSPNSQPLSGRFPGSSGGFRSSAAILRRARYRFVSPFSAKPFYGNSITLPLITATYDTLVKHAIQGLERIYHPGHDYQKAGIMLLDIRPKGQGQITDPLADVDQRDLFDLPTLQNDKESIGVKNKADN